MRGGNLEFVLPGGVVTGIPQCAGEIERHTYSL